MKKSLMFALKNTYAIGISWIPIAIAFGLLVQSEGCGAGWTLLSGVMCPFGSLQMLAFSFAASNAAWYTMLIAAAALSFRHLFYGLSFLEEFKKLGMAKHYVIYMLCDEAYSVFCSAEIPEDLSKKHVYIFTALVLQLYWLGFSTLFTALGAIIPFDLTGVEFALTALFTVIFLEMLLSGTTRLPAVCAGVCGLVCLLIFGAEDFLMPALIIACTALVLLRGHIEKSEKEVVKNA